MARDPAARKVTIRDVAAQAGVSPTTVSHALNGKGVVDASTRARVVETAGRLGYQPSRAARALRLGRTGTIALVLPSMGASAEESEMLTLDYYLELAGAAARTAFSYRHPLVLTPPLRDAEEVRELAVDGAIVCDPATGDPRIAMFADAGLAVVTVERDLGRPRDPWHVRADNEGNMRDLLDHLAQRGAKRIALLAADSNWAWSAELLGAYEAWCAAQGREPRVEATSLRHLETSAYGHACALLDAPEPPDAIIATAERYAGGVLRAARDRGLRVPGDLLVASAMESRQTLEADVTAIDLQPKLQGAAAADLLLARLMGDEAAAAPTITPSRLLVRASTSGP